MEQLLTSLLLSGHIDAFACKRAVEKTGSLLLRGATLNSLS